MRYAILFTAMLATPAMAQTSNFYGQNGQYLGTMQSAGRNNNFIYDSQGNVAGSTARAGNNTYIYNNGGNYLGEITNSPLNND